MGLVAKGAAGQPAREEEDEREAGGNEGSRRSGVQAATRSESMERLQAAEGGKALTRSETTKA
jgi:hypothetical protein